MPEIKQIDKTNCRSKYADLAQKSCQKAKLGTSNIKNYLSMLLSCAGDDLGGLEVGFWSSQENAQVNCEKLLKNNVSSIYFDASLQDRTVLNIVNQKRTIKIFPMIIDQEYYGNWIVSAENTKINDYEYYIYFTLLSLGLAEKIFLESLPPRRVLKNEQAAEKGY